MVDGTYTFAKDDVVSFTVTGTGTVDVGNEEKSVSTDVKVNINKIHEAKVALTAAKASYVYGSGVVLNAELSPAGVASGKKVSGVLRICDKYGNVFVSKAVTVSNKAVKLSYTLKFSADDERMVAGTHTNAFYAEFIPNLPADGTAPLLVNGRGNLETLEITPKELKVSGLTLSVKITEGFDGEITIAGTPKLSNTLKDANDVRLELPETITLPAPESGTALSDWLAEYKKGKNVDVSEYLAGEDADNYSLVLKITLKK